MGNHVPPVYETCAYNLRAKQHHRTASPTTLLIEPRIYKGPRKLPNLACSSDTPCRLSSGNSPPSDPPSCNLRPSPPPESPRQKATLSRIAEHFSSKSNIFRMPEWNFTSCSASSSLSRSLLPNAARHSSSIKRYPHISSLHSNKSHGLRKFKQRSEHQANARIVASHARVVNPFSFRLLH